MRTHITINARYKGSIESLRKHVSEENGKDGFSMINIDLGNDYDRQDGTNGARDREKETLEALKSTGYEVTSTVFDGRTLRKENVILITFCCFSSPDWRKSSGKRTVYSRYYIRKDNNETVKHYKDYDKVYIGYSDMGKLVFRSANCVKEIVFGEDGSYSAYITDERCKDIPEHYRQVGSFSKWLKIYDDNEMTFDGNGDYIVYRAGNFGIIIKKISA